MQRNNLLRTPPAESQNSVQRFWHHWNNVSQMSAQKQHALAGSAEVIQKVSNFAVLSGAQVQSRVHAATELLQLPHHKLSAHLFIGAKACFKDMAGHMLQEVLGQVRLPTCWTCVTLSKALTSQAELRRSTYQRHCQAQDRILVAVDFQYFVTMPGRHPGNLQLLWPSQPTSRCLDLGQHLALPLTIDKRIVLRSPEVFVQSTILNQADIGNELVPLQQIDSFSMGQCWTLLLPSMRAGSGTNVQRETQLFSLGQASQLRQLRLVGCQRPAYLKQPVRSLHCYRVRS